VRATSLDQAALTRLFNQGFSDYVITISLDEIGFRHHVDDYDIDLGASRAVIDEEPVSFALIGRRDTEAWIGGMGTVPSHRRLGLGERAVTAAIEAAFARGCRHVWLEVLEDNQAAFALFFKLGFQLQRDLIAWSLPANAEAAQSEPAADLEATRAWIAANRPSREPWQRAAATLDRLLARGVALRGVVVRSGGEIAAAVVYRDDEHSVAVLQIVAADEGCAARALTAAAAGRPLRLTNVPIDEPVSHALERLGARQVARQHELRLTLG
jgi:ribosomal protein S18 acetylase RimI-like enzyme